MVEKSYLRCCGIEVVNGHTLSLKENLALCSQPRRDQVFHNFLLGIDCDAAARQGFEIDAMPLLSETNFHAIMNQAFLLHSLADARFSQKFNGTLLEDTSSHPLLTVPSTSSLDHDRMYSLPVQQVRQDKPCGSGSHNPKLCTDSHSFFRGDF